MMNRWIEIENTLVNLDAYSTIQLKGAEIIFDLERIYFSKTENAQESYKKIKAKLNLTEWE